MPTLILGRQRRRKLDPAKRSTSRSGAAGLSLFDANGTLMWSAPFSPQNVDHGGLAPRFADGERDGRPPLLLRASDPRPTMSFECLLAYRDIDQSVEPWLNTLRYIAQRPHPVRVAYGPSESLGLWRLTDLGFSSVNRNAQGSITRATVRVGLTRAVEATTHRGPLSGGTKPAPGTGGRGPRGRRTATASGRRHVVKRGDTLAKISVTYYRTHTRWQEIATANGITDPKRLPIGKVLRIP